jgi:hypothetical protein
MIASKMPGCDGWQWPIYRRQATSHRRAFPVNLTALPNFPLARDTATGALLPGYDAMEASADP